ncbi:MAG: DNA-directed RNA polymerase subunit alpha [Planctomycetes bacterium]|nr:DNA-directed RNA polymerase subunit alpha [Planctomycetota bacterium]MDA8378214.1 DNA-directed RNA polymerase subunit alpha [Planctomycetia bacterium]
MRMRWRGLELPTKVDLDTSISTDTYGKFVVEPFERGFGTTIGNSLRRVLLSSLEGAAAVSVRIAGAEHEFAQIPGVVEDVTDIILNVKGLVLSLEGDIPKNLSVQKKGPGVVTAGDLKGDPALQIHNKDLVIATLNSDIKFDMELEIRKGRGFVTAAENTPEEQIIGVIPIDSIYSPVTRVRYKTEDTRVGQKTNYDRLLLEIWTNGTISPEMALVEAAKILRKHLNAFLLQVDLGSDIQAPMEVDEPATPMVLKDTMKGHLDEPLSTLGLSVRANNCLESARIHTIGDMIQLTDAEIMKVRSFGKTSLREIKAKLQEMGFSLGMQVPEEEPAKEDEKDEKGEKKKDDKEKDKDNKDTQKDKKEDEKEKEEPKKRAADEKAS